MLAAVLSRAKRVLVELDKEAPLLLRCLTENDNCPAWCYALPKVLLKSQLIGSGISVEKQIDGFYLEKTIYLLEVSNPVVWSQREGRVIKGNMKDA